MNGRQFIFSRTRYQFGYLSRSNTYSIRTLSSKVVMESNSPPETSPHSSKKQNLATVLANFSGHKGDPHGAVATPIYQTSTFDCREQSGYDYTRSGNPTRDALEEVCRNIEHAHSAFAFTSGMTALSAVTQLLQPGDNVLACEDIYGGMHRLLLHSAASRGINIHFVKTWDLEETRHVFQSTPSIKQVFLESPTNPQMRVSDIRGICSIAHEHGSLVCIDNSLMSPVLMTPLDIGVDIVMHSATKFLSGHSDVMAGVLAVKDPELAKQIKFVQNAHGTGLSPFDSFLVSRGMKTMLLRVNAAQANAQRIADFLVAHKEVTKVNYLNPKDTSRPEVAVHFSQAKGGGSVLSFETGSYELSKRIVSSCKLFKNTVSFGSVSSLIELPGDMSHASIPEHLRTIPADLIRLSVGIEDITDLLSDLGNAINTASTSLDTPESLKEKSKSQLKRENTIRSLPLGVSLPPQDEHAVGVSMPRWQDVVNYEEGDEMTHKQLTAGYPRFVFLKNVKLLNKKAEELFAGPGESAMVVPSARVALRLQQFLSKAGVLDSKVHDLYAMGVFAVTYPVGDSTTAKAFWQHTGEIVSSRQAAAVLQIVNRTCYENESGVSTANEDESSDDGSPFNPSHTGSCKALRSRIAGIVDAEVEQVFLYPTGMAAITAAHRLLKLSSKWQDKPLPTVVWGFPYLDTLKVSQLAGKCYFFGRGDEEDFFELERMLENETISGLFCEFPSNPLLISPDLERLRQIADTHKFPLICDDTVAGFSNVDLLRKGGVDILCSSLTKQFSGSGNVMGGSLVLNKHSSFLHQLHSRLVRDHEDILYDEDAAVLLNASWDLDARCSRANTTTDRIVDFLHNSDLVENVYYPKYMTPELYSKWKRDSEGSGFGALFSVKFKKPEHSKIFYDTLNVAKGPGFGTNFTLSCPYTVIAHYAELDWANEYGVDASLVRVWIGQEDPDELLELFQESLRQIALRV